MFSTKRLDQTIYTFIKQKIVLDILNDKSLYLKKEEFPKYCVSNSIKLNKVIEITRFVQELHNKIDNLYIPEKQKEYIKAECISQPNKYKMQLLIDSYMLDEPEKNHDNKTVYVLYKNGEISIEQYIANIEYNPLVSKCITQLQYPYLEYYNPDYLMFESLGAYKEFYDDTVFVTADCEDLNNVFGSDYLVHINKKYYPECDIDTSKNIRDIIFDKISYEGRPSVFIKKNKHIVDYLKAIYQRTTIISNLYGTFQYINYNNEKKLLYYIYNYSYLENYKNSSLYKNDNNKLNFMIINDRYQHYIKVNTVNNENKMNSLI